MHGLPITYPVAAVCMTGGALLMVGGIAIVASAFRAPKSIPDPVESDS